MRSLAVISEKADRNWLDEARQSRDSPGSWSGISAWSLLWWTPPKELRAEPTLALTVPLVHQWVFLQTMGADAQEPSGKGSLWPEMSILWSSEPLTSKDSACRGCLCVSAPSNAVNTEVSAYSRRIEKLETVTPFRRQQNEARVWHAFSQRPFSQIPQKRFQMNTGRTQSWASLGSCGPTAVLG